MKKLLVYNVVFMCMMNIIGCGNRISTIASRLYSRKIDYLSGTQLLFNDSAEATFSLKAPIKVITYLDSLRCPNCVVKYMNNAIKFIETIDNDSVNYVCVFQTRPLDEIQYILDMVDVKKISVIYDVSNTFLKHNSIEKIPLSLTTFLLNSDDKIVLIGDPLNNNDLRLLYQNCIKEMIRNSGYLSSN